MERAEILATMADLKLYGMKAAYDEIIVRIRGRPRDWRKREGAAGCMMALREA